MGYRGTEELASQGCILVPELLHLHRHLRVLLLQLLQLAKESIKTIFKRASRLLAGDCTPPGPRGSGEQGRARQRWRL